MPPLNHNHGADQQLVKLDQHLARTRAPPKPSVQGLGLTKLGRMTNSGRSWPRSLDFCQRRPTFAPTWPSLVQHCQTRVKVGAPRSKNGPFRPILAEVGPDLGSRNNLWTTYCPWLTGIAGGACGEQMLGHFRVISAMLDFSITDGTAGGGALCAPKRQRGGHVMFMPHKSALTSAPLCGMIMACYGTMDGEAP